MTLRLLAIMFIIGSVSFASDECKNFVEGFIGQSSKNATVDEYKQYLSQTLDTKYITKFSLGSNWRALSPEQRRAFHKVYSKYIIIKYASRFAKYPALSHKIQSITTDRRRKDICNVSLLIRTIVNGEEKEFPLQAIVKNNSNNLKIQDIIFENISMLQSHRQEISSLMESHLLDGTMSTLEDFISKIE